MGLQLTDQALDTFLASSHTMTVTTLRRDGWPISLPVWFIWVDGRFYIRTPPAASKLKRIRHDDRCSVLVESGDRWVELKAAHICARAVILDDGAEAHAASRQIDEKYEGYGPPLDRVPEAVVRAYAVKTVIRLDPVGDQISWDNSKIRLAPG